MARKGGKDQGLFEYPKASGSDGFDIGMLRAASIQRRSARRRSRASAICSKTEIAEERYFPNRHRRPALCDDLVEDRFRV